MSSMLPQLCLFHATIPLAPPGACLQEGDPHKLLPKPQWRYVRESQEWFAFFDPMFSFGFNILIINKLLMGAPKLWGLLFSDRKQWNGRRQKHILGREREAGGPPCLGWLLTCLKAASVCVTPVLLEG